MLHIMIIGIPFAEKSYFLQNNSMIAKKHTTHQKNIYFDTDEIKIQ